MSSLSDRAGRIDAKRRQRGISIEQLARIASVSERSVRRALREGSTVSDTTITAIEQALIWSARGSVAISPIRVAWRFALFLMADDLGVSMSEVDSDAAAPARKATNDPQWMRVAAVRRRAVYLLNAVVGFPQHELVQASGMTPAGVSRVCREIEDERDADEALNRRFDELAAQLMGA